MAPHDDDDDDDDCDEDEVVSCMVIGNKMYTQSV